MPIVWQDICCKPNACLALTKRLFGFKKSEFVIFRLIVQITHRELTKKRPKHLKGLKKVFTMSQANQVKEMIDQVNMEADLKKRAVNKITRISFKDGSMLFLEFNQATNKLNIETYDH